MQFVLYNRFTFLNVYQNAPWACSDVVQGYKIIEKNPNTTAFWTDGAKLKGLVSELILILSFNCGAISQQLCLLMELLPTGGFLSTYEECICMISEEFFSPAEIS